MVKSNKIGCFSDIHIGLAQDNSIWHQTSLDFAQWASDYYLKQGINDIIILGDIFHNRTEISVNTLSVAKKFFDYFKDFNVYILAGNHDSFYKDHSLVNSISIFDGWHNIKIVDNEPLLLKIGNKNTALIPWGTTFENIPNVDVIFGHFEITTFYMNNFKVCEHGFSSENLFEKAKIILSGHFHKKDHRVYNEGEIVYLGSPYQQNYGDCNDERGIYIYDINENKFTFIENKISPIHVKISVKKLLDKQIETSFLKEKVPNNHICLVIDTKIDEDAILLLSGKIQKLNPKTFRIDYEDVKKIEIDAEISIDVKTTNLLEDIGNYVNSLDIDNKKEVVSYINELYNVLSK